MIEVPVRGVLLAACLAIAGVAPCRAAEQWIRLTSPNFEIYTDASQKDGRELLSQFEQARSFFLKAAPVRMQGEFPVRIIAFRAHEEFLMYTPSQIAVAYFTGNAYRDYIVLSNTSEEAFGVAMHEYTHLAVRHSGLHLPLWLSEGWADVFSSMRHVSGGIAVGDLVKTRAQFLERGQWIDLDRLAAVTQDSPEYHEADRAGLFYSESWALAHMLYLSPEYKAGFAKFLNATDRGTPFSQAAESAFGRTAAQIYQDLRMYLTRRELTGQVFEVALDRAPKGPEIAPVTEFDIRLVMADLRANNGETARAAEEYEALAKVEPDRPEIVLSLGYLALQRKERAAALQYFQKAFAAGEKDPRMCFQLAVLEQEAQAPAAKVIPILERAVQGRPDFTDALVNLGLMRTEARDYEGAIEALMKVEVIIPSAAPPVFIALAYANLQTGHLKEARSHLATARQYANAQPQLTVLTEIEGLIDARSKSRFPPQRGEKLQTLNGMGQGLECRGSGAKLKVLVNGQPMLFELPEPKSVEFSRPGGNVVQLNCQAPAQPFPIVVEYAAPNIVRRLQF